MKKTIITFLLALVAIMGQGQNLTKPNYPEIPLPEIPEELKPASQQKIEAAWKLQDIKMNMDWICILYESIADVSENMKNQGMLTADFKRITQKNKELDKQWKGFFKSLKDVDIPSSEAPQLYDRFYNGILTFYSEQNKVIAKLQNDYGTLSKEIQEAQSIVIKLSEKYNKKRKKTLDKMTRRRKPSSPQTR
jgi:hypothetical protein